jgi:UV DNA damage endonuclease
MILRDVETCPKDTRAADAIHDAADAFPPDRPGEPVLGMVCLSSDESCKFRALTRSHYLKTPTRTRSLKLRTLYWDNLQRLHWTLGYCARRHIKLYRITSGLFPMSDEPAGRKVLESMPAMLSSVGRRANRLGIRLLLHPDQFVVLNSESPQVAATSRKILKKHALWFDLMGLERSPWNLMNLHGGKGGRGEELIRAVGRLPAGVRNRLTFENDEHAYSSAEILHICRETGCPMVFDCHHHVIHEKLDSYDHPSVAYYTDAARETWPDPAWQVCHVSNGDAAFRDRCHSERISMIPKAFRDVPWIEVEARGKEQAILALRHHWPESGGISYGLPARKPTAAETRADAS